MTDKIETTMREQVAEFLPGAFHRALGSYHTFVEIGPTNDSKKYAEYQAACKAAMAHVELLCKLARWAEISLLENGNSSFDFDQISLIAKDDIERFQAVKLQNEDDDLA